jgi:methenyltetrahydrofolate cyclohydrolase
VSSFPDQPLQDFLDKLAARTPAPGGGGAAAMTAAMAAALVAMAARFSDGQLPDAGELAEAADSLRTRAAALADRDALAYRAVLDAYALPKDTSGRRELIREALREAAAVPLEIAEISAQAAEMAVRVAGAGNPNLRGDAVTAALLAAGAARSAACLVDINVGMGALESGLSRRAAQAVAHASEAAERAVLWRALH